MSPQDDRLLFSAGVFRACASDLACTEKKLKEKKDAKASGQVWDSLFVRHWDTGTTAAATPCSSLRCLRPRPVQSRAPRH